MIFEQIVGFVWWESYSTARQRFRVRFRLLSEIQIVLFKFQNAFFLSEQLLKQNMFHTQNLFSNRTCSPTELVQNLFPNRTCSEQNLFRWNNILRLWYKSIKEKNDFFGISEVRPQKKEQKKNKKKNHFTIWFSEILKSQYDHFLGFCRNSQISTISTISICWVFRISLQLKPSPVGGFLHPTAP